MLFFKFNCSNFRAPLSNTTDLATDNRRHFEVYTVLHTPVLLFSDNVSTALQRSLFLFNHFWRPSRFNFLTLLNFQKSRYRMTNRPKWNKRHCEASMLVLCIEWCDTFKEMIAHFLNYSSITYWSVQK